MYRILVADDEAHIRQGIQYLLDYEALGFTVCAEAADGIQTLSRLLSLQPDVVLLDIRMPGMTGLEVLRSARLQGYRGHAVVVSSYTDFKYAQEAIRYGVEDYITKPIDEDDLADTLRRLKTVLDEERRSTDESLHYREKAHYAILKDILLGEADLKRMRPEETDFCADEYQVLIVDKYSQEAPSATKPFASLLCAGSPAGRSFEQITLRENEVYLLKGSGAISQFQKLLKRYEQEDRHSQPELDAWFITYGRPVSALDEVAASYQQALLLKSRRFFCDQGQHTLGYTELPSFANYVKIISNEMLDNYASRLLDCIQSFNRTMMADTLREMQFLLRNSSDSIEAIKLFLADLHLQIKSQMKHLHPNDAIPFYRNADIIRTIEQSSFLYECIRFLAERFEALMAATGNASRDSVLGDILYYIHHNYATNITLESIAPLFGYNRSYLGKIFRKKMGQNFNSYVDYVRIEQSKILLLNNNAKVYAIAELVGYKNVDYFHIKFKKYVGMSPAEFRKKNRRQTADEEE